MLLFTPKFFEYLENDFIEFFNNIKDEEKDEFLIPEVIDKHIKNGNITIRSKDDSLVFKNLNPQTREERDRLRFHKRNNRTRSVR